MEPQMSLLAGYDVVIELSNELVRDLIIANLRLSGAATAPPLVITIPLKTGLKDTIVGAFQLNVTAVEVDLQTTRPMAIKLFFEGASVETPTATVRSLDGCIEIPVYFPDVLTKNNDAFLSLDLSEIEPWSVSFTRASMQYAEEQLQGTTLSYLLFESISQETLCGFIQKQPLLVIPLGLNVTSKEGAISPLRFYQLEAHGIGPTEKAQQALGLFGTLLAAHSYEGTPSFKTTTAIPAGKQIALSISADVFHRFVLCDGVAEVLKCAVRDLPTTCGDGGGRGGHPHSCYSLNSIEAKLKDNSIALCGGFKTDLGDGAFESEVALRIDNGAVISAVKLLDVSVSTTPPYREGPFGQENPEYYKPLVGAIVAKISQKICEKLAYCAASALLGGTSDQVSVIKDEGISFACKHKVKITGLEHTSVAPTS
jgi:hypothetical protein